jgi:hypothetical protein
MTETLIIGPASSHLSTYVRAPSTPPVVRRSRP